MAQGCARRGARRRRPAGVLRRARTFLRDRRACRTRLCARHSHGASLHPWPYRCRRTTLAAPDQRRRMMELVSGLAHGFTTLLSPLVLAAGRARIGDRNRRGGSPLFEPGRSARTAGPGCRIHGAELRFAKPSRLRGGVRLRHPVRAYVGGRKPEHPKQCRQRLTAQGRTAYPLRNSVSEHCGDRRCGCVHCGFWPRRRHSIRAAGNYGPHGVSVARRRRLRPQLRSQRACDDRSRTASRPCRHGHRNGRRSIYVRHSRAR